MRRKRLRAALKSEEARARKTAFLERLVAERPPRSKGERMARLEEGRSLAAKILPHDSILFHRIMGDMSFSGARKG